MTPTSPTLRPLGDRLTALPQVEVTVDFVEYR